MRMRANELTPQRRLEIVHDCIVDDTACNNLAHGDPSLLSSWPLIAPFFQAHDSPYSCRLLEHTDWGGSKAMEGAV